MKNALENFLRLWAHSPQLRPPPPDLNLCLRIQLLTMKRPDYV